MVDFGSPVSVSVLCLLHGLLLFVILIELLVLLNLQQVHLRLEEATAAAGHGESEDTETERDVELPMITHTFRYAPVMEQLGVADPEH